MTSTPCGANGDRAGQPGRQRVVADLGTRALECDDLESLFRDATAAVAASLETDSCTLLEARSDDEGFRLQGGDGCDECRVGATVPADPDTLAGVALERAKSVVVTDLDADDRVDGPAFLERRVASGIAVLVGPPADPWGVLATHASARQSFDAETVAFVQNVANSLTLAIERDRANRRHDAEATLTETIVETSPIGITIVDRDGKLRFANDRAEELFARSRERIDELSFDDPEWDEITLDGTPLERESLPFLRILETGGPLYDQRSGVLRPDGERVWISVNGAPLFDESGAIDAVVFAIEDITERVARKRELERYETAVETVHDGIYVLDEDRRFELVNDAFVELTQLSREELLGSHASLVYGEEFASIEAEQRESTVGSTSPVFEETILEGAGRYRTVENRFTLVPTDAEGAKRIGVIRDVTERTRLRRELEAERTLKDRILETSPVGITLIDADGVNVYANEKAEDLFGRSLEELRTYTHDDDRWELIDEDGESLAGADLPFTTVSETGEPVYDEVLGIEQPDGTRVWLSAHCAPLFDTDGAFDGAVYALKDITERKRLESDLETTLERVTDAIHGLDTDWNFTYINDHAAELLGDDDGSLVGKNVWEAFPSAADSRFEREYRRAMDSQETVTFEEYSPVVGGWLEVTAYPSESGLSVYFRDVTDRREMEATLRESEERFRTLAEHLDEVVWLADADPSSYAYVNPAYEAVYGKNRESLYEDGLSWLEIVHPDDRDRVREAYLELPDCEYDEEFRVVGPDGETRWIHASAVAVTDEEGRVERIVGIDADVTERKERERTLEKYRTIVETVDDGIYIVDDDGRFTMVNRAYTELTGYERAELLGSSATLVADEAAIGRARALVDEPSEATLDAEIETVEGDRVAVEATLAGHVDDESGERRRIGVVRDVTERKERERQLEESERRYRTLVEHFPNGAVGLFDDELRYTLVGGELLDDRGVSPAELVDTSIFERYPDDVVAELEPRFRAALTGESDSFEFEYDGRQLHVYTLPVRDDRGSVFAGMLMVQDVSDRVEYQRKLEASNERLEQFAYAASHDLQEPLRMVSSYLTLIDRRYGDELDEDAGEFIEYAVDGADRMREMIDGLLEFSRVETQGEPFEPLELDDILADVRRDLELQMGASGAEITAESLPRVDGDGNQVRQVFQNLLSNAIEYAGDEPPRIEISSQQAGEQWVISVADEGIGIDPDDADRIFGLFNRLHAVDEHPGSGIGLALCQRIVERHGGEIWVDTEPGEGATFSFTLPAAETANGP
ncbi:PAS domain S-box protein [Natrarchaeobaculum sulfurireducens]|uniref:histidine kinase n=1 Tax=Natrarchaeobaculum sulfurireducens TaxID=2044521 RepID=A0A346PNH3_9EURY|nr:PAS domain S-box protein [Natrarchaeobaculum sulfurireducens]AXR81068.1 Signal transduction histidine kinase [Natrarchaeobaculum sulfurireducens]